MTPPSISNHQLVLSGNMIEQSSAVAKPFFILFFSDAPHRRVNGGLGDPSGVTIPGTTLRPYLVWYGLTLTRVALIGL